MITKIMNKVDYVIEGIELLYRYINEADYRGLKQKLLNKYSFSDNQVETNLDKVIEISDYVYKNMNLNNEKERLNFFFQKLNDSKACLAKVLLLIHPDLVTDSLKERIEIIHSFNLNEIYTKLVAVFFENDMIDEHCKDRTDITLEYCLKLVEQMDLSMEQKWNIERAILHYHEYLDELTLILEEVISPIQECEPRIQELTAKFYEYWTTFVENNDISVYLEKTLNINFGNIEEVCLIPFVAGCNTFFFNFSMDEEGNPINEKCLYMYTGILFDDSFYVNKKPINNTVVYNNLKLLGDKSKFDILLYIKDQKAYGQELATMLGLTTPTISHHMNALFQAGFVHIERDANRVYYSMNQEKIEDFIQNVKKLLLEP
jgi:DNA-binding HxlR family transcriptional regulator